MYRLPELLAASTNEWTFVVEGEKDADRLAAAGLIATCNPDGAGKWGRLSTDAALHGHRVAIVPDNDPPGRAHAEDVAKRLNESVAELRILEIPGGAKDVSDWLDGDGTADNLRELARSAQPFVPTHLPEAPPDPDDHNRPTILIDTEEHRAVTESVEALNTDPDIFQRGGMLVRAVRGLSLADDISRPRHAITIGPIPRPNLRDRITRVAKFCKKNRNGESVLCHPPGWLVNGVDARGIWRGIRPLLGVSDTPVLRPDGTLWQQRGYDAETAILYEPTMDFPELPARVSLDRARAATNELLELVCDFRFESDAHRSAWLAGLLTPLARSAFDGPSPLFLMDANVRGAGKGLLVQTIASIVLGRRMSVSGYAHDSHEMRKRITAIASAGDRMVLLDNLAGTFGNDALDRALTSVRWQDRILGKSVEVELPLILTWFATGNNVRISADTCRRVLHIRLDVLEEHPEHRSDFRHKALVRWTLAHRGHLLTRALSILIGYCSAGRPTHNLAPFGSFEGWSDVVREAMAWVGLPDPCATQLRLAEAADSSRDTLAELLSAWKEYDPVGRGVAVAELLKNLYTHPRDHSASDGSGDAMRAALERLTNCPLGKAPTARQLGNKLRQFRRRIVDGTFLDVDEQRGGSGKVWRLHHLGQN